MGRTLFWYVFKDLIRIFGMTAGALAGIMSFGGLLRPLTQQGLDLGQISKMLGYFTPAMMAYSLPIAALFAATVVYGRLSADNELTACRAGGISLGPLLGMAFPTVIFGMIVACISLALLCFVVPVCTLQVERVVYSNLAKLIANRIERTHEIRFGSANVYAESAEVAPPDPAFPDEQRVTLYSVSIVQYESSSEGAASKASTKPTTVPSRPASSVVPAKKPPVKPVSKPPSANEAARKSAIEQDTLVGAEPTQTSRGTYTKVPKDFLVADQATLTISGREDDQLTMIIQLVGGSKFPRESKGGMQAGIATAQFGPLEIPSPIKEDAKFMPVDRLHELYKSPEKSKKIIAVTSEFVRREQIHLYAKDLVRKLSPKAPTYPLVGDYIAGIEGFLRQARVPFDLNPSSTRSARFDGLDGSRIIISIDPSASPATLSPDGEEVVVSGSTPATVWFERTDPPPLGSPPGTQQELSSQSAREVRVRISPELDRKPAQMHLTIELLDRSPGGVGAKAVNSNYSSVTAVAMPQTVYNISKRKVSEWMESKAIGKGEQGRLRRELMVLDNNILAEFHGRLSFAASCFILVLVGACLGMLFKSGNFLTAFAISFVPALICITLIVAGQQTCHAVPLNIAKGNPLNLGLGFVWSGNVLNLAIATWLLTKMQRQ